MKKRIAILGGSLFQKIKIENGKYVISNHQSLYKVNKVHDIDNFSVQNLTSTRALQLINSLVTKGKYDDCILALGEEDLENPELFVYNLNKIINLLRKRHIRPLLVSLPNELLIDEKAQIIEEIIDQIALEKNVDYIHNGKTSKMVSYIVLDEKDMTRALLDLC